MGNYLHYLEESTNTVRSNKKKGNIILIAAYLVIWAMAILVFWFFTEGSDAMGYSLMFLWILLPAATFFFPRQWEKPLLGAVELAGPHPIWNPVYAGGIRHLQCRQYGRFQQNKPRPIGR